MSNLYREKSPRIIIKDSHTDPLSNIHPPTKRTPHTKPYTQYVRKYVAIGSLNAVDSI